MTDQQTPKKTILQVTECHVDPYPYQAFLSPTPRRYVGFFTNEHGEQWLFLYDQELGGGLLTGGDVAWEIYPLGNGSVPVHGVVLDEAERLWLEACWKACQWLRGDQPGSVPENVLTLGLASMYWRVPETTLKRHAATGELVARKLGNIWITTIEAMVTKYGKPKDITSGNPKRLKQLIQDNQQGSRAEQDEIKRRLAGDYWQNQTTDQE